MQSSQSSVGSVSSSQSSQGSMRNVSMECNDTFDRFFNEKNKWEQAALKTPCKAPVVNTQFHMSPEWTLTLKNYSNIKFTRKKRPLFQTNLHEFYEL